MDNQILKTKRLTLIPIKSDNDKNLYRLYSNPEVMKTIYSGRTFTEVESKDRAEEFALSWKNNSFGFWSLIETSANRLIGYAGFRYYSGSKEIELGYIIDQPYWGKKYASEAVLACVDYGFNHLNFARIMATVLPDNQPSINVLKRVGMQYQKEVNIDNTLHHIYAVDKEQYQTIKG